MKRKKKRKKEKKSQRLTMTKLSFSYMILGHLELIVTLPRFYSLGLKLIKKPLHGHCLSHDKWKGEHGRYTPWIKGFAQVARVTFIFLWPKQFAWWSILSVRHRGVWKFCTIIQSIKSSFVRCQFKAYIHFSLWSAPSPPTNISVLLLLFCWSSTLFVFYFINSSFYLYYLLY